MSRNGDGLVPPQPEVDPRRWITLGIVVTAVLIAAIDGTVLNVAIPTILRDFHTTLPSLQWVITGYSLTFAALLIIGGRLGDIFGPRRMFMIGAALFGIGSLIAALSTGVLMLVAGEAIIEGIGASLMLPATLGILTTTFQGRERATAFAAWGATAGVAVAFGPPLGGFLTTNYSWRWAFVINVVIVPFAILGARLFMREVPRSGRRQRIDVPGAMLIASGMLLLVFGISEGGAYGWWKPLKPFVVAGWAAWPTTRPVSIASVAFVVGGLLLFSFYRVERAKGRAQRDPLFDFDQLRHLSFRYGLATLVILAMGQFSFLLVVSVILQDGRHLSALDTGLWLIPSGVSIIIGSQAGSRLTHRFGPTAVVRVGLMFVAVGLAVITVSINDSLTFLELLPGVVVLGLGLGVSNSQLTNVILSEIPPEKAGAASGANATARMIGSSLGIAIMSTMLSVLTVRYAVDAVQRARTLTASVQAKAIAQLHRSGVNFSPAKGTTAHDMSVLRQALGSAVADAGRPPLIFATIAVLLGVLISLLIPRIGPLLEGLAGRSDEEEAAYEAELLTASITVE